MSSLYPLLLSPLFDRRPWGARDLAPIYDIRVAPGEEPIGEAWLTSDRCSVVNGAFAGAELGELCRRFGHDLVGTAAPEHDRFPLLMKFLFPREKLSVQVHPNDEGARRHGHTCGKTECWYVVTSDPGAQIGLGLKSGITRSQFKLSISEGSAEQSINWIDVHAGEMFYVDAGTVHALAPGSVILETQQNSDVTYRLYDYGRGRELHVQDGLDAIKENTRAGRTAPAKLTNGSRLIASPFFVVDKLALRGEHEFITESGHSAQVLVAINGSGVLEAPGFESVDVSPGRAVIIPTAVRSFYVHVQQYLELLQSGLPIPQRDTSQS